MAVGLALGIFGGVGPARGANALAFTNPSQNVAPSPGYWSTCTTAGSSSQTCYDAALAAINHARSLEGVPPMQLPSDFGSLTVAEQTFVVTNLERVDRGLPAVAGMVDSLNTVAEAAATAGDWARDWAPAVLTMLAELDEHLYLENFGLFPGAISVLDAGDWDAIEAARPAACACGGSCGARMSG